MRRPTRDTALVLLLGLFAVGGAARLWAYGRSEKGVDFYQFWLVARSLGEGAVSPPASLYTREAARRLGEQGTALAAAPGGSERQRRAAAWFRVLEPAGTPLFYSALRPLGALGFETAFAAWQLGSLAAWLLALAALGRLLGLGAPGTLALICASSIGSEPALSDVRVANVNRLLCAALVLFLWLGARAARAAAAGDRRRSLRWQLAAGAWLGLAVVFKPALVPVAAAAAAWRLARRGPGALVELAGGALGLLGGAAAGAAAFGSAMAWPAWLAGLELLVAPGAISVAYGNYAPARLLAEAIPAAKWQAILALLAAIALALLLARAWRRPPAAPAPGPAGVREAGLGLGLGFGLLLATSPLVWLHYQLLALPALFAAAPLPLAGGAGEEAAAPGWPWLAAWTAALACITLEAVIAAAGLSQPRDYALVVVAGDALLCGLCFGLLWRRAGAAS